MTELHRADLHWIARRLPSAVSGLLKQGGAVGTKTPLMLAGGFIRACIAREDVHDIDLFGPSKDVIERSAFELQQILLRMQRGIARRVETKNAITICVKPPVQFIHRWTYATPEDLVASFDFTIACAAVWWSEDEKRFKSLCHPDFYADLAAKRLVYTSPVREEAPGGSMLRVLKFYGRGYRIPLDSLSHVVDRLTAGIDSRAGDDPAKRVTREQVIRARLYEVDPLIDPSHVAHLPPAGSDSTPEEEIDIPA